MDKRVKKTIRLRVNEIMDVYCDGCERVKGISTDLNDRTHLCNTQCTIGQHLQKLGKMLLGEEKLDMEVLNGPKPEVEKTPENYRKLKEEGHTDAEIARMFGVTHSGLIYWLDRRGLRKKGQHQDGQPRKETAPQEAETKAQEPVKRETPKKPLVDIMRQLMAGDSVALVGGDDLDRVKLALDLIGATYETKTVTMVKLMGEHHGEAE